MLITDQLGELRFRSCGRQQEVSVTIAIVVAAAGILIVAVSKGTVTREEIVFISCLTVLRNVSDPVSGKNECPLGCGVTANDIVIPEACVQIGGTNTACLAGIFG